MAANGRTRPATSRVVERLDEFAALADESDELTAGSASPFLTHAWLQWWCSAYLDGDPICVTIRDGEGALTAAVCLKPGRLGLRAAANVESGDWDAVARDTEAAPWLPMGQGPRRRWLTCSRIGAARHPAGGRRPIRRRC
jgi:hypothetical protein